MSSSTGFPSCRQSWHWKKPGAPGKRPSISPDHRKQALRTRRGGKNCTAGLAMERAWSIDLTEVRGRRSWSCSRAAASLPSASTSATGTVALASSIPARGSARREAARHPPRDVREALLGERADGDPRTQTGSNSSRRSEDGSRRLRGVGHRRDLDPKDGKKTAPWEVRGARRRGGAEAPPSQTARRAGRRISRSRRIPERSPPSPPRKDGSMRK